MKKATKKVVAKNAVKKVVAKKPETTIYEFIVKKVRGQRRKVGVIVGVLDEKHSVVRLGWSRANFSKGDVFDKQRGMNIAIARTKTASPDPVCHSFRNEIARFASRCKRYFKNAQLGVEEYRVQNTAKRPNVTSADSKSDSIPTIPQVLGMIAQVVKAIGNESNVRYHDGIPEYPPEPRNHGE